MNRFAAAALVSQGAGHVGIAVQDHEAGDSSVNFLQEACVDTEWVKRKFATIFNVEVLQNLKKAVYGASQGANGGFRVGENYRPVRRR